MRILNNNKAQMAIEYLLVFAAVVLVLLAIMYPLAKYPQPISTWNQLGIIPRTFFDSMQSTVDGVGVMANSVCYKSSGCP